MKHPYESIAVLKSTVESYHKMIDGTVDQLSDEEFFRRPSKGTNSVAVILRHLGGNLISRWTEFLTTDGEKESRNRDMEFEDWNGTRAELVDYFDRGWMALIAALDSVDESNIESQLLIRGEPHTLMQALVRSITHVTYHVGQITLVARLVHDGDWNWLTIAPNSSAEFNSETWGTSKSRAVFDADESQE